MENRIKVLAAPEVELEQPQIINLTVRVPENLVNMFPVIRMANPPMQTVQVEPPTLLFESPSPAQVVVDVASPRVIMDDRPSRSKVTYVYHKDGSIKEAIIAVQ